MYEFMEYCLRRYYLSTGWREENQYSNLCSWSRSMLDFYTPRGLSLYLSKLPTPHFKPSYTMNALPSLNGSFGYLYTSQPLEVGTSATVEFQDMVERFHVDESAMVDQDPVNHFLLYGRMFFPGARLEAMYVRRLSTHLQYLVTAINQPRLAGQPQVAMQLQYDVGKWCSECSYTTDDGLLGIRALYNFGQTVLEQESIPGIHAGQWALGTELYYGTLDKSGGLSVGLRYHTLPSANTPPICFTYTLNPLIGHMSTAYVAQVSDDLALCSRYDFNIYSYESDLALGFEYRTQKDHATTNQDKTENLEGLIKARVGFSEGLALMWEGRFKKALVSFGLTADLSSRPSPIRTIGIEVQFFS
ncbi:hypothetical protein BX666DRAFT_1214854 [Dichotomocladium elegans]|nr:hypothetical protein BX666DRAFT_1214854 [Dichotomocladium elegans]